MYVAKTKALISFAVTAKLICVLVFAYAKSRFSHDEAHIKDDCYKLALDLLEDCVSCFLSCIVRKPVFGVSYQVQHTSGSSTREGGKRFEILDIENRGIVLSV